MLAVIAAAAAAVAAAAAAAAAAICFYISTMHLCCFFCNTLCTCDALERAVDWRGANTSV